MEQYLAQLGKYLVLHGIIHDVKDLTLDNYTDLIKQFQNKLKLPLTGRTDADTLWELQFPFVVDKTEYFFKEIDVDLDAHLSCSSNFTLRNDIYDSFKTACDDIHNQGGKVFSSGSLRPLNAEVTPGRSHTSLHYTGIAFDLCINAGFTDPQTDPYVVVRERFDTSTSVWKKTDIYFKIYCRSDKGTKQTLKGIYWENHTAGVDLFKEVEDNFICITDILMKHGFSTIAPRAEFLAPDHRNYLSSEWWHFNGLFNICHGFSQFGIELIKTFGLEKVQNSPVWNSRKAIFNYSGFIMQDYIDPSE